ncbi:TPA: hypothetical protein ACXJGC_000587 [Burkholderia cenocepacia]
MTDFGRLNFEEVIESTTYVDGDFARSNFGLRFEITMMAPLQNAILRSAVKSKTYIDWEFVSAKLRAATKQQR